MSVGNWFWIIYVIAILFGSWFNYEAGQPLWYRRAGAYAILWILVGFLGYRVFGFVVKP
jgi:hypothetical protein